MKCGEVIDLMIGMWCILIKNEKNVLYIHADREGVISIYIDVEGEEYGWRLRK